jgi:hypothetical protein
MRPIEVKFDDRDNLVRVYPSKKYVPYKESLRHPQKCCTKDLIAEKDERLARYVLRKKDA